MNTVQPEKDRIFNAAAELTDASARAAFLDQACGGNPSLRAEIEDLLRRDGEMGSFLNSPPPGLNSTSMSGARETVGSYIGSYKLLEELGEGGMGVVYMAEQTQPVKRRVAIKIIKQGMDTRQFVARFEAERQALAMMDHPNIARILDAGCTDTGRPYFVMELAKGIPISQFCDENRLTNRERIELFASVCHAVQHAHQKGVIHRDLKPTNVLVALYDDRPVPKVIDFGVAKATNQQLTEKTLFTRFGQILGTWEYMSPEQAVLNQLDVDTRSDVYSLGVILYELLTGVTPLESERLRSAALDETLRLIREEDPPKPSTRVSSLGKSASAVATYRGTNVTTLAKMLRGDLDWIVMRALEKHRSRRYDSANALAADLMRYLSGEPILARPPSTLYRLRKTASRHRGALAASAVVVLALLATAVISFWHAVESARIVRRLAKAQYEKAIVDVLMNDPAKASDTLDMAEEAGYSPGQLRVLEGLLALNNGDNDGAVKLAEEACDIDPHNVAARALLCVAYVWSGQDDLGERELQRLRGSSKPESNADRLLMAYALLSADPEEARRILNDAEGIERSPLGLLIRGFLTLFDAWSRQDARLADQAIRDFEYVQFLFNDNRSSLGFRLLGLAAGIRFARAEGWHEVADRYEEEGRRVADKLAAAEDYPAGDWTRQQFYLQIGEDDAAWDAICGVGRHSGSYSWFLAAMCLERYGAKALDEFDKTMAPEHCNSKYVKIARRYLMVDPTDRASHRARFDEGVLRDKSPFLRRHALLPLCLIGDRAAIKAHALAEPKMVKGLWNDMACLRYMADEISESSLLDEAGEDYVSLANAYFTIAMMRLAEGKQDDAIKYFERCVATNATGFFDCEWARGYLSFFASEAKRPRAEGQR